jgi:peptidoglycan/LPS O-acetylase OafA/YrhL
MNPHIPALDGLRAIAITLVLLFHGQAPYFGGGWVGVDVFFVLSGFLITGLLAQEYGKRSTINLQSFFLRRMLRLYPALLAMLAGYLLISPLFGPGSAPLRQAMAAAAYLSDYGMALYAVPINISHTWSLAVEAHYYLIWPMLLLAAFRACTLSTVRNLAFLAYLLATLWRAACANTLPWGEVYYGFDTRLPGLLLGSWLALAMRDEASRSTLVRFFQFTLPAWLAALAACAVTLPLLFPTSITVGVPIVEWASAALVVACYSGWPVGRFLASAPLVQIGKLSYGVYLWHNLLFEVARLTNPKAQWWEVMSLCVPASLLLAWASFVTVEHWAQKLRKPSRLLVVEQRVAQSDGVVR